MSVVTTNSPTPLLNTNSPTPAVPAGSPSISTATPTVTSSGNEGDRTATPTSHGSLAGGTHMPSPAPVVATISPTVDFSPKFYGDGSFGYGAMNPYIRAGQNEVRRPGWSWGQSGEGYGPFCYQDTCYDITEACKAFSGTQFGSSFCAFPNDVQIAGPSCWQGVCTGTSDDKSVCDSVGGKTVGTGAVQWCIFKGENTLLGPACFDDECYSSELAESCSGKGKIWNSNFCIYDGYKTIVGPVCWKLCLTGPAKIACESASGTLVAGRWCVLDGCDRVVLGPFCYSDAGNTEDMCWTIDAESVCSELGGALFGDRFCVLNGANSWSLIGPTCYSDICATGQLDRFCRNVGGKKVGEAFCVAPGVWSTTSPNCVENYCYQNETAAFCKKFDGQLISVDQCALEGVQYRQVVGPLMFNDNITKGNPDDCQGLFCAIPATSDNNPRCPQADPISSRPTTSPAPTSSPKPSSQGERKKPTSGPPGSSAAAAMDTSCNTLLLAFTIASLIRSFFR